MAFSTYDRHWNNVNLCQYWLNNRDYLFCWNSLFNCSFLPDNLGSSHQPYFLKPETNFWVMVPRAWNAFSLFYSSYYSQYCIINFLYSAAHIAAFYQNLLRSRLHVLKTLLINNWHSYFSYKCLSYVRNRKLVECMAFNLWVLTENLYYFILSLYAHIFKTN